MCGTLTAHPLHPPSVALLAAPFATVDAGLRRRLLSATVASDVDAATERVYTWQEVAKHNTAESAWVIVGSKVRVPSCKHCVGSIS